MSLATLVACESSQLIARPEYPKDWDVQLRDLMVRFFNKNPTERIRMFQIRVSTPSLRVDKVDQH